MKAIVDHYTGTTHVELTEETRYGQLLEIRSQGIEPDSWEFEGVDEVILAEDVIQEIF